MCCDICKADDWKDLDYIRDARYWIDRDFIDVRNPKIGFKICQNCGFVTYDERPGLEDHYRKSYRKLVGPGNITTTNRKNEWHEHFIGSHLKDGMQVLDIGCAFGASAYIYEAHWCDWTGTELTDGFVAYGQIVDARDIRQTANPENEFNPGSFDVIQLYHVLEHIHNPLSKILALKDLLTDRGVFYISVPIWFGGLEEHGGGDTIDFENYYHIDHVCCFSHNSIRNLFKMAGLEIIKEDTQIYGHTFLLRPTGGKLGEIEKDDPAEIEQKIIAHKKAMNAYANRHPDAAISIYPDYPDAWTMLISRDGQKDLRKTEELIQRAMSVCSRKYRLLNYYIHALIQWDENQKGEKTYTNNIKKAEMLLEEVNKIKPNDEQYFFTKGLIEHVYKKNPHQAIPYFKRVMEINPARWGECVGWIGGAALAAWEQIE